VSFGGCAAPADDPGPLTVPLLALTPRPTLEIGVFEGDPAYMFEQIVDVVRLPDGRIGVSDGRAARISLFSADGRIERSWGGRGDGPGEFRGLARLLPWSGDSIVALDAMDRRLSVFDGAGAYGREIPAPELSGDSVFAMDVWLHRRFVVEGALTPSERASARTVLDRLTPPAEGDGYRRVKAAREGRWWVREPGLAAPGAARWVILDPSGHPEAVIDVPGELDIADPGSDDVLGRWLGESDVNYVRAYGVVDTGTRAAVPGWLARKTPPAPADAGPADPGSDDLESAARSAMKQAATSQEIHYATHFRYSDSADSLDLDLDADLPDGLRVHVLRGDDRGWTGIVTHPALDRICGLGFGNATPAGWPTGMVVCGR
jgi:hypothetical protein